MEKTSWVLINFLTNAIKFSPDQSVIEISAYRSKDKVEFLVTDHGRGIDEKYLPRIFERYFKVPGSHDRNGTGLGLSISKEFIEAQGGRIWVSSQLGAGSRFGFALTAGLRGTKVNEVEERSSTEGDGFGEGGGRVLVRDGLDLAIGWGRSGRGKVLEGTGG